MEYEDASNYFMGFLKTIRPCIVPLYKFSKEQNRPMFVGTSVYCAYGPIRFLFSARHVFEDIFPYKPMIQFQQGAMIELPFIRYTIANDEEIDLGIVELTGSLGMWSPISADSFRNFTSDRGFQHFLVGYPASYTKKSKKREQRIKLQGYLTEATPEGEYERLKVDSSRRLIVNFRKDKVYNEDRVRVTFSNPNGMSGGAVFQFKESNPNEMNLVGIMTDWDVTRRTSIVATRIEEFGKMFNIKRISIR